MEMGGLMKEIKQIGPRTYTKEGDVFEFISELEDESVDIVFTDPPYPIGKVELGDYSNSKTYKKNTVHYSQLTKEDLRRFIQQTFEKMKPNSAFFMMTNREHKSFFIEEMEAAGLSVKNELVWVKLTGFAEGMAMGTNFLNATEYIIYAHKGKIGKVNSAFNVFVKNSPNRGRNSKPEELYAYFLQPLIKEGQEPLIIDPFAGSDPLSRANIRGLLGNNAKTITNYLATGDDTDPATFAKLLQSQTLRGWM
jgi:DNA modification methylase